MNANSLGLLAAGFFTMAGPGNAHAGGETCVQVQVAGQSAAPFACLNQELQSQALVASGHRELVPPLGAASPSNASGTFNQAGLAEQYGKNLGVSAMPYRPPPPIFNSPVN